MIAASPTPIDWWMLITIGFLLLILIFFAVAEMGLSRMSKPKAQALADSGTKGGAALLELVSHPERWVNPLLLSVNICQTVQATLTGVVAGSLFGPAGVAIGVLLNVVVFFVFGAALTLRSLGVPS
jgi:Mg2+/Co2+ transporter CorB